MSGLHFITNSTSSNFAAVDVGSWKPKATILCLLGVLTYSFNRARNDIHRRFTCRRTSTPRNYYSLVIFTFMPDLLC